MAADVPGGLSTASVEGKTTATAVFVFCFDIHRTFEVHYGRILLLDPTSTGQRADCMADYRILAGCMCQNRVAGSNCGACTASTVHKGSA